jgi:hypothetical protein
MPVLFREEAIVPREFTVVAAGLPPIHRRRPHRHRRLDIFTQLLGGPFLAAFDAGIYDDEAP